MAKSNAFEPIGWAQLRDEAKNQASFDFGDIPRGLYVALGVLAAVFVAGWVAKILILGR